MLIFKVALPGGVVVILVVGVAETSASASPPDLWRKVEFFFYWRGFTIFSNALSIVPLSYLSKRTVASPSVGLMLTVVTKIPRVVSWKFGQTPAISKGELIIGNERAIRVR